MEEGSKEFFVSTLILPKNWAHLLVGVKPKTQPSQRSGERKIYYLQQVRRTPGIFAKAVSLRISKMGEVLS